MQGSLDFTIPELLERRVLMGELTENHTLMIMIGEDNKCLATVLPNNEIDILVKRMESDG